MQDGHVIVDKRRRTSNLLLDYRNLQYKMKILEKKALLGGAMTIGWRESAHALL